MVESRQRTIYPKVCKVPRMNGPREYLLHEVGLTKELEGNILKDNWPFNKGDGMSTGGSSRLNCHSRPNVGATMGTQVLRKVHGTHISSCHDALTGDAPAILDSCTQQRIISINSHLGSGSKSLTGTNFSKDVK